MKDTLLKMEDITKEFPGVKALDQVNMTVETAEIHALCGENGAGKSTLMNVLSGIYPYGTYEGRIRYQGKECRFRSIRDSEREGIVIIHQELALVPYLSIAENMFLGNERARMGVVDWDETNSKSAAYMALVGLHEDPRTLIKDIGVGKQQLVEIAKALAKDVKLLILDEPTSALNEGDARNLLDLLLRFKKEQGIASILISHKLSELSCCADKITVIRDGRTIETLDRGEDVSEERIIRGMVGREMTSRFPQRTPKIGEVALEVRNWTCYHSLYTDRRVVDSVSLTLRKGEIVGIAGLIGAGRTELCKSLFGHAYGTRISGELLLHGQEVHLTSIPQAIEAGLAYCSEDRKGDGLILTGSIKHNMTLARPAFISHHGVIDGDLERHEAEKLRELLGVKCPTVEQAVDNLSGGNQQKVLVAKWIFAKPDILLMDEPTRGVDVGAKYEIYEIIGDLAAQGKAVLLVSSELPELLGMCDRIYVMNEGRIIAELTQAEATQEKIMGAIMQDSKGERTA